MKCPYCGNKCADEARYCDVCKQPLPTPEEIKEKPRRTAFHRVLVILLWIACFAAVGVGIYKLVFWIDSYNITRLYTRGAYTPTVNEVEMDDGRIAHALIFYGQDGDRVFLPEINECLSICGGVARLEIADADWFTGDVSEYDYADICFSPVLMREDGTQTRLPNVEYSIDVPESPLEVVSPATEGVNVVTSVYPIDLQVVAGSNVYINGEDLTEKVDRSGALSVDVSVQPIGDNTYTVIVRTPRHKETRRDIILYREKYDIEIELDSTVKNVSNETTMTVSGSCEPGAAISVDTPYVEESLIMDMTTGRFQFLAKFSQFGNNTVRFRATKEGRADAVLSIVVNYKPTLAAYSANAWKLEKADYEQLRILFEEWHGKVFRCNGVIVDSFQDGDTKYMVMDTGSDGEERLIILENLTTISPSYGPKYSAWADVEGRYMYNSHYYPLLTARYMDLYEP